MATTADGIIYPIASDFIAPLNAHIQALAESVQTAIDARIPETTITYTPTFTGLTIGNGSVIAKYNKVGAIIVDEIIITFGSTTAVTGNVTVLGLQPSLSAQAYMPCGNVSFNDSNSSLYFGTVVSTNATSIDLLPTYTAGTYASRGALSATIPFTWGVADQILIRTVRLAA